MFPLFIKQKCLIADCDSIDAPHPFEGFLACKKHIAQLKVALPRMDKIVAKCQALDRQKAGAEVTIYNWTEFSSMVKPEVLDQVTGYLALTKGTCINCGNNAVGTTFGFKPLCEDCMPFPRNLDRIYLKG